MHVYKLSLLGRDMSVSETSYLIECPRRFGLGCNNRTRCFEHQHLQAYTSLCACLTRACKDLIVKYRRCPANAVQ